MVSLKDKGNKAEDYVLVNGGERFKVTRIEDHDGGDSLPFLVHFERDGNHDQLYMGRDGVYDRWHLERVHVRGAVDLRQDSNPQHYTFIDKEGVEHEVVGINKNSANRALPYRIEYKEGGCNSHFVFAWNGDSRGIDDDEYDIGYLIQKSTLRIFDFGDVKANAHDIQIHYEDYGDTVKLVDVINVLSINDMVHRFGIVWFDNHYRHSTPKTDFVEGNLFIYEGEGDYYETKKSTFTIGETYDKAEFMRCMEVVQEAAKNLSRLRKEFGVSKKKTITI
jgi:hypothetical protein